MAFFGIRDTYGYTVHPASEGRIDGAVAYVRDIPTVGGATRYLAKGFRSAKQINDDFLYSFKSPADRDSHVARWFKAIDDRAAAKLDRRAKAKEVKAKGHPFAVGTLLVNSWGYEQTNIDFYQVVAVNGDNVTIREIGYAEQIQTNWEQYDVKPARDKFVGEPIKKRVVYTADGRAYLRAEFGCLSITSDDRTHHRTCYA